MSNKTSVFIVPVAVNFSFGFAEIFGGGNNERNGKMDWTEIRVGGQRLLGKNFLRMLNWIQACTNCVLDTGHDMGNERNWMSHRCKALKEEIGHGKTLNPYLFTFLHLTNHL